MISCFIKDLLGISAFDIPVASSEVDKLLTKSSSFDLLYTVFYQWHVMNYVIYKPEETISYDPIINPEIGANGSSIIVPKQHSPLKKWSSTLDIAIINKNEYNDIAIDFDRDYNLFNGIFVSFDQEKQPAILATLNSDICASFKIF